MSKTHAEFLEYLSNAVPVNYKDDPIVNLGIVIEIAHKLKQDFGHFAKWLDVVGGERFLDKPVLDSPTDYTLDHEEYGATEEDSEVLDAIQGYMQNLYLTGAVINFADESTDVRRINYASVRALHDLGYKVYIHADMFENEPFPDVYIDIGTLLIKL